MGNGLDARLLWDGYCCGGYVRRRGSMKTLLAALDTFNQKRRMEQVSSIVTIDYVYMYIVVLMKGREIWVQAQRSGTRFHVGYWIRTQMQANGKDRQE